MSLTAHQYKQIREFLDQAQNPLFFFHDDPDGLCSFLLLHHYKHEGNFVIVKTTPLIDHRFYQKLEEYKPDMVFILDIAQVTQEFVDTAKVPVVWIDHHEVDEEIKGVHYFNPRASKEASNVPTTELCYQAVGGPSWIAMVGAVSDWYVPSWIEEFDKEYPGFIKADGSAPDQLFSQQLGILVKMFSFCLKGKTSDAKRAVKHLRTINSPLDLLSPHTKEATGIVKHYEALIKSYNELLTKALVEKARNNLLVYSYHDDKMSLTKDISNEVLYKKKSEVVLICRIKEGQARCSLRSPPHINVRDAFRRAMSGLRGGGGGHEQACGLWVDLEDFSTFCQNMETEINK